MMLSRIRSTSRVSIGWMANCCFAFALCCVRPVVPFKWTPTSCCQIWKNILCFVICLRPVWCYCLRCVCNCSPHCLCKDVGGQKGKNVRKNSSPMEWAQALNNEQTVFNSTRCVPSYGTRPWMGCRTFVCFAFFFNFAIAQFSVSFFFVVLFVSWPFSLNRLPHLLGYADMHMHRGALFRQIVVELTSKWSMDKA